MKYGIRFFVALCLIITGCFIGATEHKNLFVDIKWTDIGTLIVTFFGFTFGFFTYFQWINNKRREDAYFAAKKYIASIDEVEELLREIQLQYNQICPAPGVLVESKDMGLKRIEHLNNVWNYLYQAQRSLYKSQRELEFWNVRLNKEFYEDYKTINKLLNDISIISSSLNNQLFHFIEDDMKNIISVSNHKKKFDALHNDIHQITQKRVSSGFKRIFIFDQ